MADPLPPSTIPTRRTPITRTPSTTMTRSMARLANAAKLNIQPMTEDQKTVFGGLRRKRAPLLETLKCTKASGPSMVIEGDAKGANGSEMIERPQKMARTEPAPAPSSLRSQKSVSSPSPMKTNKTPPTRTPNKKTLLKSEHLSSASKKKKAPSSALAGMKTQVDVGPDWSPGSESSEDTLILKPTPQRERVARLGLPENESTEDDHIDGNEGSAVLGGLEKLPDQTPMLATPTKSKAALWMEQQRKQRLERSKEREALARDSTDPSPVKYRSKLSVPTPRSTIKSPLGFSQPTFKVPSLPPPISSSTLSPSPAPVDPRPLKKLGHASVQTMSSLPRRSSYAQPTQASLAKLSSGPLDDKVKDKPLVAGSGSSTLKRRPSISSGPTPNPKRHRSDGTPNRSVFAIPRLSAMSLDNMPNPLGLTQLRSPAVVVEDPREDPVSVEQMDEIMEDGSLFTGPLHHPSTPMISITASVQRMEAKDVEMDPPCSAPAPTLELQPPNPSPSPPVPVLSKLSTMPRRPSSLIMRQGPGPISVYREEPVEPKPQVRKLSYPSCLGSGPLSHPTNRVVSNPVVRPPTDTSNSELATSHSTSSLPPARSVSESQSNVKPNNRRQSLHLETSKSLHGLSAALAKLQVQKTYSAGTATRGTGGDWKIPGSSKLSNESTGSTATGDLVQGRLSLSTSKVADRPAFGDTTNVQRLQPRKSVPQDKKTLHVQSVDPAMTKIFKGVIVAVDVRTAEGDDSSQYFVDVLKMHGARVSKSLLSSVANILGC